MSSTDGIREAVSSPTPSVGQMDVALADSLDTYTTRGFSVASQSVVTTVTTAVIGKKAKAPVPAANPVLCDSTRAAAAAASPSSGPSSTRMMHPTSTTSTEKEAPEPVVEARDDAAVEAQRETRDDVPTCNDGVPAEAEDVDVAFVPNDGIDAATNSSSNGNSTPPKTTTPATPTGTSTALAVSSPRKIDVDAPHAAETSNAKTAATATATAEEPIEEVKLTPYVPSSSPRSSLAVTTTRTTTTMTTTLKKQQQQQQPNHNKEEIESRDDQDSYTYTSHDGSSRDDDYSMTSSHDTFSMTAASLAGNYGHAQFSYSYSANGATDDGSFRSSCYSFSVTSPTHRLTRETRETRSYGSFSMGSPRNSELYSFSECGSPTSRHLRRRGSSWDDYDDDDDDDDSMFSVHSLGSPRGHRHSRHSRRPSHGHRRRHSFESQRTNASEFSKAMDAFQNQLFHFTHSTTTKNSNHADYNGPFSPCAGNLAPSSPKAAQLPQQGQCQQHRATALTVEALVPMTMMNPHLTMNSTSNSTALTPSNRESTRTARATMTTTSNAAAAAGLAIQTNASTTSTNVGSVLSPMTLLRQSIPREIPFDEMGGAAGTTTTATTATAENLTDAEENSGLLDNVLARVEESLTCHRRTKADMSEVTPRIQNKEKEEVEVDEDEEAMGIPSTANNNKGKGKKKDALDNVFDYLEQVICEEKDKTGSKKGDRKLAGILDSVDRLVLCMKKKKDDDDSDSNRAVVLNSSRRRNQHCVCEEDDDDDEATAVLVETFFDRMDDFVTKHFGKTLSKFMMRHFERDALDDLCETVEHQTCRRRAEKEKAAESKKKTASESDKNESPAQASSRKPPLPTPIKPKKNKPKKNVSSSDNHSVSSLDGDRFETDSVASEHSAHSASSSRSRQSPTDPIKSLVSHSDDSMETGTIMSQMLYKISEEEESCASDTTDGTRHSGALPSLGGTRVTATASNSSLHHYRHTYQPPYRGSTSPNGIGKPMKQHRMRSSIHPGVTPKDILNSILNAMSCTAHQFDSLLEVLSVNQLLDGLAVETAKSAAAIGSARSNPRKGDKGNQMSQARLDFNNKSTSTSPRHKYHDCDEYDYGDEAGGSVVWREEEEDASSMIMVNDNDNDSCLDNDSTSPSHNRSRLGGASSVSTAGSIGLNTHHTHTTIREAREGDAPTTASSASSYRMSSQVGDNSNSIIAKKAANVPFVSLNDSSSSSSEESFEVQPSFPDTMSVDTEAIPAVPVTGITVIAEPDDAISVKEDPPTRKEDDSNSNNSADSIDRSSCISPQSKVDPPTCKTPVPVDTDIVGEDNEDDSVGQDTAASNPPSLAENHSAGMIWHHPIDIKNSIDVSVTSSMAPTVISPANRSNPAMQHPRGGPRTAAPPLPPSMITSKQKLVVPEISLVDTTPSDEEVVGPDEESGTTTTGTAPSPTSQGALSMQVQDDLSAHQRSIAAATADANANANDSIDGPSTTHDSEDGHGNDRYFDVDDASISRALPNEDEDDTEHVKKMMKQKQMQARNNSYDSNTAQTSVETDMETINEDCSIPRHILSKISEDHSIPTIPELDDLDLDNTNGRHHARKLSPHDHALELYASLLDFCKENVWKDSWMANQYLLALKVIMVLVYVSMSLVSTDPAQLAKKKVELQLRLFGEESESLLESHTDDGNTTLNTQQSSTTAQQRADMTRLLRSTCTCSFCSYHIIPQTDSIDAATDLTK